MGSFLPWPPLYFLQEENGSVTVRRNESLLMAVIL